MRTFMTMMMENAHALVVGDELEHLLVYRCQKIMEQQEFVRGLICFH